MMRVFWFDEYEITLTVSYLFWFGGQTSSIITHVDNNNDDDNNKWLYLYTRKQTSESALTIKQKQETQDDNITEPTQLNQTKGREEKEEHRADTKH